MIAKTLVVFVWAGETENRTRMYFILQANSIVHLILFREPYRQFYSPTTGHFLSHDIPVL